MFKLNLTRDELETIKDKAFLTEMQVRIIEYRLKEYSIVKMSELEHCSESTIYRELRKIKKKIVKFL